MPKAGGRNKNGQLLQTYIKNRAKDYGILLRETAGSGNTFSSDSDLQNDSVQIESKQRTSPDGLAMPKKSDWKKLCKESQFTNRFPMIITSGANRFDSNNVLVTLRLDHLFSLINSENCNGKK